MSAPLLDTLPRLRELRDGMSEPEHADSFFREIERKLRIPTALGSYQTVERYLAELDDAAWDDLRPRAALELISRIRGTGRGWEPLFNLFNEARGYTYLKRLGCTGIRFVERRSSKTPDLEGSLNRQRVLCEVKTVNIADEEVDHRQRVHRGEIYVRHTATNVDEAFLTGKLGATITHAIAQLDCEDKQREAKRLVLIVLHFNDWVGDYQPEYLAQIDRHLGLTPVIGAELVFWIASNLFERKFTMRNAIVITD